MGVTFYNDLLPIGYWYRINVDLHCIQRSVMVNVHRRLIGAVLSCDVLGGRGPDAENYINCKTSESETGRAKMMVVKLRTF